METREVGGPGGEAGSGGGRGWFCVAYGPELPESCFFEQAGPACVDLGQCEQRMKVERQRVFRRMQELAAHGDPVWADLADEFASPEDLLDADPDERPEPGAEA